MIDGYLKLGGKELPFKRSLGALRKFDKKYRDELNILELGVSEKQMHPEHVIHLVYLFIEAGYRAEGKPIDIDEDWIDDNVTLTDLNSLTSVLTGSANDVTDEKKTYKGSE